MFFVCIPADAIAGECFGSFVYFGFPLALVFNAPEKYFAYDQGEKREILMRIVRNAATHSFVADTRS